MKLWGVHIDEITKKAALEALDKPQVIFTPNPEILLEARKNSKFNEALAEGTLMLPDGHGLLLVSSLLLFKKFWRLVLSIPAVLLFLIWKRPFKRVFPEIIHGSDFMDELIHWSALQGKSVYFLGGGPGIAERTARFFQRKYSHLRVAGFSDADPGESAYVAVKETDADVLLVAYGAPKQELWISQYAKRLKLFHVMGVGGSFDFWSGNIKRAPHLMRILGLEWLWRLLLNPRQRARRIFNATILFPLLSLSVDDR